jgi:hypothetical protein
MSLSLRDLRRLLAVPSAGQPDDAFTGQERRFAIAQTVIRCFYGFLLYLAIEQFGEFGGFVDRQTFAPLWPVLWLQWAHSANATRALLALYTGASFLAAVWPGPRWTRALAALGMLEFVALKYSFGKIGHSLHLPVGGAIYQIAAGQPNAFMPSALGAHVAQRLLQTDSTSALGAWIIGHPWLTWPLMPVPIYLEFFSFWLAFRPPLQRLWAAALITFHMATFFTMTISFPQSCFLLAIFFFASPWQSANCSSREIVLNLPLFGDLLRLRSVRLTIPV